MSDRRCIVCDTRPPRPLPAPIPEGTEVMLSEGFAGWAFYCQECFDATEGEPDE